MDSDRECKVSWCVGRVKARDWCATHYVRNRNGLDMDKPIRRCVEDKVEWAREIMNRYGGE